MFNTELFAESILFYANMLLYLQYTFSIYHEYMVYISIPIEIDDIIYIDIDQDNQYSLFRQLQLIIWRHQRSMSDYFTVIPAHVQGDVDIDSKIISSNTINGPYVISIGSDDIISWRNIQTKQQHNIQLPCDHGYNKIALSPNDNKFIVGGSSKKITQMYMGTQANKQPNIIYESQDTIFDIKFSNNGKMISIATGEQKCIIVDLITGKKNKCRPGHSNKIYNTFFSPDDKYVATIGGDSNILIYELSENKDPQQVFRTKLPTNSLPTSISGCFHRGITKQRLYVPGMPQLIQILYINSHWDMKKTSIAHSSPIICCQTVSQDVLAASCSKDLCLWSIETMQKLVVLQQFPLTKIIAFNNRFIGIRNDGNIYVYNRSIPSVSLSKKVEMMDIEQNNQSRIQFDNQNQKNQYVEPLDLNDYQQQDQRQVQVKYISSKKSKADKIIEVYPQLPLSRATELFDNSRFLYVNMHGCIIENRQGEDIAIQMQVHDHSNTDNIVTKTIFRDRQLTFFSMNAEAVCYASSSQFGVRIDKFSSWQKKWYDIDVVALGGNWMAVANSQEIKVFDLLGNHIKTVAFSRQILSMHAYQNLLVVVYHESIPMWNRQMLSMEIFSITQLNSLTVSNSHVPITEGSCLKWFGFSEEGMLFSQDSFGFLRSYSLQANQWTSIYAVNIPQSKRMWILGIKEYQIHYWKTTDEQPVPTVRPRLNLKTSSFGIATLQQFSQQMMNYPLYLWQRFALDHELARWRLWGHHKKSRSQSNRNYSLSLSILNEKQIFKNTYDLDNKFCQIVLYLLKNQQSQRALSFAKSHIRTTEVGKFLIDEFDNLSRNLAIQLQQFYDEKRRELEYEAILELNLQKLKTQAENSIQPKKNNPMNPKNKRVLKQTLPFNFSQSSVSNSIVMQDITYKQQEREKDEQSQVANPFQKKKSQASDDLRKKQIEQQVQKFGIKKKADRKRGNM